LFKHIIVQIKSMLNLGKQLPLQGGLCQQDARCWGSNCMWLSLPSM